MEGSSNKDVYDEDYSNITLKDTIIPEDVADSVPEEDYSYYYLDKRVAKPKIVKRFTPNIYNVYFNYGHKMQERMIFPDSEGYTEEEEEKLEKFNEFVEKKGYELPEGMTKRRLMRFLYGNNFKHKDIYKNINEHTEWISTAKPFLINDEVKELLDSGMMYIHGRDKCLRPIFFIQSEKITSSEASPENIMLTSWFVTYYGVDNMCETGKVENWVSVNDMANLSMRKLPLKFIGNLLKEFQKHLLCRGRKFCLLNVTFGIRAIWKMLSPFVDANTHLRTDVTADSTHQYLQSMVHPSQLEARFGGEAPDLERFWPPKYISNEFGVEESMLKPKKEKSPKKASKKKSSKLAKK
jgi:hypothetical protein